jgi:hypothetical protein
VNIIQKHNKKTKKISVTISSASSISSDANLISVLFVSPKVLCSKQTININGNDVQMIHIAKQQQKQKIQQQQQNQTSASRY